MIPTPPTRTIQKRKTTIDMRLANVIRTCICMAPCVMLMGLLACKPSMPDDVLSPGKMEDILYDYHLADGMAYAEANYDQLGYKKMVYREAALRKHGVTKAEFDSSMVYYYRHTEKLHDIYLNLAKRLNNDALALGATANVGTTRRGSVFGRHCNSLVRRTLGHSHAGGTVQCGLF